MVPKRGKRREPAAASAARADPARSRGADDAGDDVALPQGDTSAKACPLLFTVSSWSARVALDVWHILDASSLRLAHLKGRL